MANPSATLDALVAETAWLQRLARSLVKDHATADDLVHDTYLVAARNGPRAGRPLRPWLARVLRNLMLTQRRSRARRHERERAVAELALSPASPEAIVDRIQVQRTLAGLVLELAPPLRDVVLLHYFEGLTSIEIGNRLGISDGTVRWRLKQAVAELRERLDKQVPNRAWVAALIGLRARHATSRASIVAWVSSVVAVIVALVVVLVVLSRDVSADRPTIAHRGTPFLGEPSAGSAQAAPATAEAFDGHAAMIAPDEILDHHHVQGVVVDHAGRRVEGAEVRIACLFGEHQDAMRTAADGRFAFDVDKQCEYLVMATKGDAVTRFEPPAAKRAETPLTLVMTPAPVVVLHVVDAETGAPIAGASVSSSTLFFHGGDAAETNSAGIARIRWTASSFTSIVIREPHHVAARATPRDVVRVGQRADDSTFVVERTIKLAHGIPVSGTVIGPGGGAAPEETVVVAESLEAINQSPDSDPLNDDLVHDAVDATDRTDADGNFHIMVPSAGTYRIRALAKHSIEEESTRIEVGRGGRSEVVIQLKQGGALLGIAIDAHGSPVAGARITAAAAQGLGGGPDRYAVTDTNGRFELHDVEGAFNVIARHDHRASAFRKVMVAGQQSVEVVLQIGPAGIAGVAVDAHGAPLPGADVWLNASYDNGRITVEGQRAIADAQGRFAFDVPPGDFVLSVRPTADDDYDDADDMHVPGGSHEVRLVVR